MRAVLRGEEEEVISSHSSALARLWAIRALADKVVASSTSRWEDDAEDVEALDDDEDEEVDEEEEVARGSSSSGV